MRRHGGMQWGAKRQSEKNTGRDRPATQSYHTSSGHIYALAVLTFESTGSRSKISPVEIDPDASKQRRPALARSTTLTLRMAPFTQRMSTQAETCAQ